MFYGHVSPACDHVSPIVWSCPPSQDDDLRELRDTREWMDMLGEVKGGMTREQKVSLRAEAKVRNSYLGMSSSCWAIGSCWSACSSRRRDCCC
jgi:hypothetical protein